MAQNIMHVSAESSVHFPHSVSEIVCTNVCSFKKGTATAPKSTFCKGLMKKKLLLCRKFQAKSLLRLNLIVTAKFSVFFTGALGTCFDFKQE